MKIVYNIDDLHLPYSLSPLLQCIWAYHLSIFFSFLFPPSLLSSNILSTFSISQFLRLPLHLTYISYNKKKKNNEITQGTVRLRDNHVYNNLMQNNSKYDKILTSIGTYY